MATNTALQTPRCPYERATQTWCSCVFRSLMGRTQATMATLLLTTPAPPRHCNNSSHPRYNPRGPATRATLSLEFGGGAKLLCGADSVRARVPTKLRCAYVIRMVLYDPGPANGGVPRQRGRRSARSPGRSPTGVRAMRWRALFNSSLALSSTYAGHPDKEGAARAQIGGGSRGLLHPSAEGRRSVRGDHRGARGG